MLHIDQSVLPALSWAIADRHLGWGLVTAAVTVFLLGKASSRVRLVSGLLILLLAFGPGPWSTAYWLGLAFQTPSLLAQGLSIGYLIRVVRAGRVSARCQDRPVRWPSAILLLTAIIGWLLALDTFARLPVQLYALGYSKGLSFALLGLALGVWIMGRLTVLAPSRVRLIELALLLLTVVLVHTLTRLPSGNLWDAVLDPWLWLLAQVALVSRGIQALRRRRIRGAASGERVL